MSWIYLAFIFFLIMDPLGNINSYLNLVKDLPEKRQRWVLTREMLIALGVMLTFNFIGEFLFYILGISEVTVRLASGLVIFLVALKILFPTVDSPRANLPKGEPYIFPLAIPLVCGPALMATLMLFARIIPDTLTMIYAIFAAWVASWLILLAGPYLKKWLGNNGLIAAEKLMGMILILLGIQRFLDGVKLFLTM